MVIVRVAQKKVGMSITTIILFGLANPAGMHRPE